MSRGTVTERKWVGAGHVHWYTVYANTVVHYHRHKGLMQSYPFTTKARKMTVIRTITQLAQGAKT